MMPTYRTKNPQKELPHPHSPLLPLLRAYSEPGIKPGEADSLSYLTDVETEVQGRGRLGVVIKVTGLQRADSKARTLQP